jgi:hypothetical protein
VARLGNDRRQYPAFLRFSFHEQSTEPTLYEGRAGHPSSSSVRLSKERHPVVQVPRDIRWSLKDWCRERTLMLIKAVTSEPPYSNIWVIPLLSQGTLRLCVLRQMRRSRRRPDG